MEAIVKRVLTRANLISAAVVLVCMVAVAFFGLGAYIRFGDRILPSISIDGIGISGLTREDAEQALNLSERELRAKAAEVTILFPDGSGFSITGESVRFGEDAQYVIGNALSLGRGDGFIMDTVTFLQRMVSDNEELNVYFGPDAGHLISLVTDYANSYNKKLEESKPFVNEDKIVIVKGAGQVQASELELFELVYNGLNDSFNAGRPIEIAYVLPESYPSVIDLMTIRRSILIIPISAEYDPETKTISESIEGRDIALADAISLLDSVDSGQRVEISIVPTHPEVTREYLESFLFRDLIGETVTRIGGSENRLNNIVLSSAAVDGYVLEPGDEFSFNQVVGRRTAERGYKSAPMISGGQTVMGLGGGICQVSSSIYSSIMDADIKVTERYPHGRPVDYLPRGRDATVSWGYLDFRFVNNTERPLRIDVEVDGRTLTVQVFGTID